MSGAHSSPISAMSENTMVSPAWYTLSPSESSSTQPPGDPPSTIPVSPVIPLEWTAGTSVAAATPGAATVPPMLSPVTFSSPLPPSQVAISWMANIWGR